MGQISEEVKKFFNDEENQVLVNKNDGFLDNTDDELLDKLEKEFSYIGRKTFWRMLKKSNVDIRHKATISDEGIKLKQGEENIYLDELRGELSKYNYYVYVDFEQKKIDIVFSKLKGDICETNRQKELFNTYADKLFNKAQSGEFRDLVNFVEFLSVEHIKVKSIDEMTEFRKKHYWSERDYDNEIDDSKYELELLGCYDRQYHEVWLCDELIASKAKQLSEEYAIKLFDNVQSVANFNSNKIEELLYKKVFTHEFGHLAFDWVDEKDRTKQEKQANYFSSYINDGEIDGFIVDFTRRQPIEYHNPYLLGDKRADELYKQNK